MATTTFSVRMDSEVKRNLDRFCEDVGMNTTTAFNIFARAVLREKRIPFDLETGENHFHTKDDFFSEEHQAFLRESIAQLERGEGIVVEDVSQIFAERP